MVYYYSATRRTAVFAEALGSVLSQPVYELRSALDPGKRARFFAKCVLLSLTGKAEPVLNMPASVAEDDVYLCAPVWAGGIAAPARFFLCNAGLSGKTVHILLTCSAAPQVVAYRERVEKLLASLGCANGGVHVFITGGQKPFAPDTGLIEEQLRQML
jgi:hypothetical protein